MFFFEEKNQKTFVFMHSILENLLLPPVGLAVLGRGLDTHVESAAQPQAIVILSGDQQRILTDPGPIWHVGLLTLQREAAGAALARRTHLPVLVSGGVIRPGAPSLATMMAASMDGDFGVKVRWQEARSGDTWGNARESASERSIW